MPQENFLTIPFLPSGDVSLMLSDGRIDYSMEKALQKRGIRIIKTAPIARLHRSIAYHPDVMAYHAGGNLIIAAPSLPESVADRLRGEGFNIIYGKSGLSQEYPKDVPYNVARIGNYAVHNFKYTDPVLYEQLVCQNLRLINVKQGYAKCSILVVDDRSIITEDEGIARAASKNGMDVLLIRRGHVLLPGMNYGFIGGAGGLISTSVMVFAGDVATHPDYDRIIAFLSKRGISICNLGQGQLMDLGSLVPLKERI